MKLDISEIVLNVGKRLSYDIDEEPIIDEEAGLRCVGPITGKVTFQNSGGHVVVRGSFKARAMLECSRCLKNYEMDFELPIEEELLLEKHEFIDETEHEIAEIEEEEAEPLFVDNIFNLTELLRQAILLAVPIKPLCSESCMGLCPRCGKARDNGPCECPDDDDSSPFSALKSLLDEKDESAEDDNED